MICPGCGSEMAPRGRPMSHFVSRAGILVHTRHLLQHHECPRCGARGREVLR